jgi:RNA polymerase sigma-70 factor (ECF subfamily)
VQGDRAAQRQLFDEQRERVHVVLFRILGTNRDIEDVVQDAFLAVFRSLVSYRGEASLATWVDRITARAAFRYLSRATRPMARLEVVRSEPLSDDPTAEQELHAREVARRLYAALDRLEPKYRIAYALHVLDERPIADVAAVTEVSLVAAKNRVWRARRMLRRSAEADPLLKEFVTPSSRRGA